MAKKLTDDDIRAQIEKNKAEHGYLQNAVGQLGDELGLQLDEKGDVVGRTEKPTTVVPNVATMTTIDTKALAKDLLQELANAQEKDGLFVLDIDALLKLNDDFRHHIIRPWNQWYIAQSQAYLRLIGMEDVCEDGKFYIREIKDSPFSKVRGLLESMVRNQEQQLPTKEQQSPSQQKKIVVPKAENPQMEPSTKSRFLKTIHSLKLPKTNSILLYITCLAVAFVIFIGNENYMLRDVARKYEIYHTFYGALPEDSSFVHMVDSQIDSFGSKRVLEHVQMRVQRMKQGKE